MEAISSVGYTPIVQKDMGFSQPFENSSCVWDIVNTVW